MQHLLTVITFLAGATWGPQVEVEVLPSKEACETARQVLEDELKEISKTNIRGGYTPREMMRTRCTPIGGAKKGGSE